MNGKKVLFILDHLKGGGAERIAIEVAESFFNNGYEVNVALLNDKDTRMHLPETINKINLDLDPIFYSGKFWRNRKNNFTLNDRRKVESLISNIEPDLTILSHNYAHLLLSSFEYSDNVWAWIHGDITPSPEKETSSLFYWYKEKRRIYLENKYFVKLFDRRNIIVVNDDLQKFYKNIIASANITTISNGINSKRLAKNTSENGDKNWDCIFVGRLSIEKQPEHAIQAFANSELNGRMAIVGDGIMKIDLEDLCVKLKIQNRVDFFGWQEDPSDLIRRSKCLVLSSSTEGSPLIIAESLILGTPVVAYRINSGIEQQLDHNELKRGLAINQNIEDLSLKICEVVNNPYEILEEDKERFSIETMMNSFLNLLR